MNNILDSKFKILYFPIFHLYHFLLQSLRRIKLGLAMFFVSTFGAAQENLLYFFLH